MNNVVIVILDEMIYCIHDFGMSTLEYEIRFRQSDCLTADESSERTRAKIERDSSRNGGYIPGYDISISEPHFTVVYVIRASL